MSTVWFSSDHHFGHQRVIEYCRRPFGSVEEMNETLVRNHNEVVRRGDRVFLLGDFFFGPGEEAAALLARLNGQKWLVRGNHDRFARRRRFAPPSCVVSVLDYHELIIARQKIVMSHYPLECWNGSHYGSYMLHGHCHGTNRGSAPRGTALRRLDVGVDCWQYRPVAYEEVDRRLRAVEVRGLKDSTSRDATPDLAV